MVLCPLLWSALAAVNLAGALLVTLDKRRAQTHPGRRRRIAHKTLRILSLLGAAPGLLLSMKAVRHKTRRHGLRAGIAALGLLGLGGWVLLLWRLGCLL